MENNLTEAQKKMLTEWMGECWHEYNLQGENEHKGLSTCSCGRQGFSVRAICSGINRSFTTPDDMMALKEKLVDKNLWDGFLRLSFCRCIDDEDPCLNPETKEVFWDAAFIDWILSPPGFCRLVAEFLEANK